MLRVHAFKFLRVAAVMMIGGWLHSALATPPLEVKGIPIGAPMSALMATFPSAKCYGTFCTVAPDVSKECPFGSARQTGEQISACLNRAWEPYHFRPGAREGLHLSI